MPDPATKPPRQFRFALRSRFTDRAHKIMQVANKEARRLRHEYIGTEHLLLSLVELESGVAANVLKNLDIDRGKIRVDVDKLVQSGSEKIRWGILPQTRRAKKVIEHAMEEARNLNHTYVGSEHILLGLMRKQEDVAAQVLNRLGATLERTRSEISRLVTDEIDDYEHFAQSRRDRWITAAWLAITAIVAASTFLFIGR